ncbi:uncharacterized protein I303_104490 [Kwoniella dejecticola CBS 10117]|uniref:Leucine-rich repeat-containing protein 40 n=1 Tax=Kwoniella dejecticola CBS 10117 TaxID=1296121 RepID=A0A1A6A559_9TREE|nr:uncharacterized protein I303_04532 [Kwoniella dejecticola CBS 10117]OBR85200.1 hypothetical protein I303_04532 [Kwoniella dejecticola CBS 10117]
MTSLFLGQADDQPPPEPISGGAYLTKLHKYLQVNANRLSPSAPSRSTPTILQQSYTLLTLGLDPKSAPLSRSLKVPLTLGFGQPSSSPRRVPPKSIKPLLLRLPPDRLLYLLLRWQTLPQALNHVGRTDVPIEEGVSVAARGARMDERNRGIEGDVKSVMSWVGSMRSVSMGSLVSRNTSSGWFSRKEEVNEDQILLQLYSMFTYIPALLIHPPFVSEPPILELIEAGGYTQLGGIDVRVPLDVMRNLSTLELEGYDPRALLIPPNLGMETLTVRDVQDGDDWIEELLIICPEEDPNRPAGTEADDEVIPPLKARFPNLRNLSLISSTLLTLPQLPLSHLKYLDLSNNLLDTLPTSLSSLLSLTALNLSNNVIVSLRSAASVLPGIISLNLSGNRIDCLIGLDQCLTLQRLDIRRNELNEYDEVGRLAVLPNIKEIYTTGNPFSEYSTGSANAEEWRVELGVLFKEENRQKEIVLDGTEFSWNEIRKIDYLLDKKGVVDRQHQKVYSPTPTHPHTHTHTHAHSRIPSTAGSASTIHHQNDRTPPSEQLKGDDHDHHQNETATDKYGSISSIHQQRLSTTTHTQTSSLKSPSSSAAAIAKKKSKRRVINLDDSTPAHNGESSARTLEDSLRGSLRGPGKVIGGIKEEDEQEDGDGRISGQKIEDENDRSNGNGNGIYGGNRIAGSQNNGNGVSTENGIDPATSGKNGRSPQEEPIRARDPNQDRKEGADTALEPPHSIKVVSSKRKSNRKGLKKDTFDPIP